MSTLTRMCINYNNTSNTTISVAFDFYKFDICTHTGRHKHHSASQTDDDEYASRTHEISPEQASVDIDKEFIDRRVWEKHPGNRTDREPTTGARFLLSF